MRQRIRKLATSLVTWSALVGCAGALPVGAMAEEPGPLQILVPYGPGNGLDLLARKFGEAIHETAGLSVVIENREGAGGIVGTSYAARAAANGQTVLFTANPPFASSPYTLQTKPYDPLASFIPVVQIGSVPLVLVTASQSPFGTFQQMKQWVHAHPAKANYAHSGTGSPGQMFVEYVKQAAGLETLTAIPYKSTGQAITDVVAGTTLLNLVSYPAIASHLNAGTVKLLAVGSAQRMKAYPDVPTFAELIGQPDFEANVWYGVFLPAGTPEKHVARVRDYFIKAQQTSSIVEFMQRSYIQASGLTPQEFAAALRRDVDIARRMIELANAKAR